MSNHHRSVGIIGGGVTGLCCAYYLSKEGHEVTVMDQGDFSDGCSFINAGMIVPSHVIPLAAPGAVAKGFRWMFRSESPFSIQLHPDKALLRWAWLFYRCATEKNVQRAIPRLRDISWISRTLYRQLASETAFDFEFREQGLLMLYQTTAAQKEEAVTARLACEAGVQAEVLSSGEVQRLEPGIKLAVKGGVYFPGDAHLDPEKFMEDMIAHLKADGVTFLPHTRVSSFKEKAERITAVIAPQGAHGFDEVVIACGAWSGSLLKGFNVSMPLQGGKGYSFELENESENIRIPSLLVEGKVAVTPLAGRLRVSGTMEIGADPFVVSEKRIRGIADTLHHFYPELDTVNPFQGKIGSGLRPCSPDGLPYIGRLKGYANVIVATGHGMMGMSLGPATGKLVSELISGRSTTMKLTGFEPGRFG
jgi:D-amino-acid dehydrogenase